MKLCDNSSLCFLKVSSLEEEGPELGIGLGQLLFVGQHGGLVGLEVGLDLEQVGYHLDALATRLH